MGSENRKMLNDFNNRISLEIDRNPIIRSDMTCKPRIRSDFPGCLNLMTWNALDGVHYILPLLPFD